MGRNPPGKDKQLLAVRTRELYEDLLRLHVDPFLGHLRLGEITPDHVRAWNDGRVAVAPTRARQAYALLRSIMRTAVETKVIVTSPCVIQGAGSNLKGERPYLSRRDYLRLLDAVPTYLRMPVELTTMCHLRVGELLALKRGDVDLDEG